MATSLPRNNCLHYYTSWKGALRHEFLQHYWSKLIAGLIVEIQVAAVASELEIASLRCDNLQRRQRFAGFYVTSRLNPAVDKSGGTITILLMIMILVVFLITGMFLSVLPLHLQMRLGQSNFIIGLITGLQFIVALGSRIFAGTYTDRHGPKSAVIIGLIMAIASGGFSLASLGLLGNPLASVVVLAVGRALLGGGECFALVGAVSWAMGVMGRQVAGSAISRIGMAMYVGLAAGAPIGSILYNSYGFAFVGLASILLPTLALLAILPLLALQPEKQEGGAFWLVLRAVWEPGLGLSFASLGYGATITFSILLFTERGWQPAWAALTIFAVAFILARLLLGHLPDRIGGARVAQIFAILQMAGLALMALSPSAVLGFASSALAGFGYSLVYPGLGLEAVQRAPPANRGLAIGVYTAFLELTLGIVSPLLGLLAGWVGLGAVFMVSALCTSGTILIATLLRANSMTALEPEPR